MITDREPQRSTRASILAEHRETLEEDSGILPGIIARRGYRSVRRTEVPPEFKPYQRRAGLLVPMFSPDGTTTGCQLRPDNPRHDKRGKLIKYETPTGARIIADVHPSMLETTADPGAPLWITEGVKCGDSLTSRGRCTISLIGVWAARKPRSEELLDCFEHAALEGRRVFVVFDSDVMVKPEVQLALQRLVGDLEGRGARVLVVYLDDAPDGSKQGVDDYLAAGGTVEYLEEIARPFEPADTGRERLSRDEQLRVAVAALEEHADDLERAGEFRGTGGRTREAIYRAIIKCTPERGKLCGYELHVAIDQRTLAEMCGVRQQSVSGATRRLGEDGHLERRPGDGPGGTTVYVLKCPYPCHKGKTVGAQNGKVHTGKAGICRGYDPLDTPTGTLLDELARLRWPYVRREWTPEGYKHEYIARLGKTTGAALRHAIEAGGVISLPELAECMGIATRHARRHAAKLADAGLVSLVAEAVRLAEDVSEKLMIARELGGEYEAEELARKRHQRARKAYKDYLKRGETLSRGEEAQRRRENRQTRREATEARRVRRREADKVLRPNYWAWRRRQHLREAGADGYLTDITVASPPEPERPERRRPDEVPKVNGIYQHGGECDCDWCAL